MRSPDTVRATSMPGPSPRARTSSMPRCSQYRWIGCVLPLGSMALIECTHFLADPLPPRRSNWPGVTPRPPGSRTSYVAGRMVPRLSPHTTRTGRYPTMGRARAHVSSRSSASRTALQSAALSSRVRQRAQSGTLRGGGTGGGASAAAFIMSRMSIDTSARAHAHAVRAALRSTRAAVSPSCCTARTSHCCRAPTVGSKRPQGPRRGGRNS
mmetsp:Transcript_13254/g.41513  ORF Transcript_13254/g.41513 Transcript_13254/m.41513 type:complete len:211 (-) Transcript_13254:94-726(-)